MRIIILIAGILFNSCSFKTPQSSSNMNQIYYTQEGKPYVLRMVSRHETVPLVAGNYVLSIAINFPSFAPGPSQMQMSTNKKIIPLVASMYLKQVFPFNNLVDIQTVYYWASKGTSSTQPANERLTSQSKMFPLVDRIYFTDNQNYGYNLRYGQAVFSENDFMDCSSGMALHYTSLGVYAATLPPPAIVLPNGNGTLNMTFLYFELLD